MYESPIELIVKNVQQAFENEVVNVVQNYGINVDKEELLKALTYDRGQYDKGHADGEWELFSLITSTYFGKEFYFVEANGLVYSRETHKHMTKDDAINEFLGIIGG